MKQVLGIIAVLAVTALIAIGGAYFIHRSLPVDDDADGGMDIENMLADDDEDADEEDEEDMDMTALDQIIEEESDIDNDVEFEEENEGAQLRFVKAPEADFLGTWEATSAAAEFMYGNVDLKILPGHKWTGNIAEEDFSGTWEYDDGSVNVKSELINLTLSFSSTGKLIMLEDRGGDGEYITTVLTRK